MKFKETTELLNKFAKDVIELAKSNMSTRGYKGKSMSASGNLKRSLKFNLDVSKQQSFSLKFLMNEYGFYQDAGIDGKDNKRGVRKHGLPTYSYKSKMPPTKSLDKWVVRRNLKGSRDASGRFVKRQSITFAIARKLFKQGIKPTYFFSDAFAQEFKKLPKKFIDKYALDANNFLKFTIDGNN